MPPHEREPALEALLPHLAKALRSSYVRMVRALAL
jgi:hypothetical protein